MDPGMGRILFNIAFLILVLSLIPLPFLDSKSAEFVVDIIALIISFFLLSFVSWDVRRQVKMTEIKESD